MLNVVAVGLLVTSMAIAGVWSPPPSTPLEQRQGAVVTTASGRDEQVIVKGGHRAVLVEYDEIDEASGGGGGVHGKTRVSISSPEAQLSSAAAEVFGVAQDGKERLKQEKDLTAGHFQGPRELVCDAFGKCKHKISSALHRAKDKVSETAQEMEDDAKETVSTTVDKTKEMASKVTHAGEKAKEKAKDVASKAGEKVEESGEIMKEKAKEVGSKTGEKLQEGGERVKEKAKDVVSSASEKVEEGKEKAKQTLKREATRAGEAVEEAGEKTKKEFSDIARRGKEVVSDAASWLVSRESVDSVMSLTQLLGIATAYGASVWVTFVMSHVLAGALPRQQFGVVQSRIYPVYFEAMAACIGLGLVGHLLGKRRRMMFSDKAEMLQAVNLLGSLGLVLANLWYYEPRASKVMFERMKLEKEEGRGTSPQPSRLSNTFMADTATPTTTATATPATTTTTTTATATTTTTPAVTGQRRVVETEVEARSKMERLSERLKKLNSYSALLNVMTLMGLTWHLVYLSQRLLC